MFNIFLWEESYLTAISINYILPLDYISLLLVLYTGLLIIFCGVIGLCLKTLTLINILICFEIILLGLNLCIVSSILYYENPQGFLLIFLLLTVGTAESALGLALMVLFFRIRNTNFTNYFNVHRY